MLCLRTQHQTDGIYQQQRAGREEGIKDTTEMPQNWVKVVTRNRPSQQRNVGWAQRKGHRWLTQRSTKEVQDKTGWEENSSYNSKVKNDSRVIW